MLTTDTAQMPLNQGEHAQRLHVTQLLLTLLLKLKKYVCRIYKARKV